ncbi:elongation factor G-like protein EF-G2 [Saccharopolyspora gloriosae]|uniref:Elongation factor G n=1 Tax=Saccharopolyspora gloriosae TaxID=455344 RepID=A0A840NE75_9PSEU|nr:elongation factor G-like protein EF-G2 [Saccharopolyspora gloriosae]MBB5068405.1 elongation factor G [Saccharopolyspora gloriosae]
MGSKQSVPGVQAAPAPTDPATIRNVVLVGPSGAGKTTLVEALLTATGTIPRNGSVVEGTTVCDHDSAAIEQQRSVALSAAPVRHDDHKINLIDTPGYADFVGELRAGLRAADAALFVVAAAEGVDAATRAIWHECAQVDMPRAVVLSRLDQHRADPDTALESCREAFGAGVLPLHLPLRGADGTFTGLMGVLTGTTSGTGSPRERERERAELIEAIIAESEDESLMDRYVAGERIEEATLIRDLETAVSRGGLHPVLPVCAATELGLPELLDGLIRGFPSPLEHPAPEFTDPRGRGPRRLDPDPAGPLAAEVVHTSVDSYVGRVSLARVFSGTLLPERAVHVSGHGMAERGHPDHDEDERVAHLYSPLGSGLREVSRCVAGDLCALTKLGSAETGDTLSDPAAPLLLSPWPMPEPLLPIAVVAHNRSDEEALARNLNRLIAADPSLRLEKDSETHQLVLWCMGEAHADVVLQRLREGGAEVDTEPVRVALRQTFGQAAKGHGKHVKQSGGHGQYAVCDIEVEPAPRGTGVEFADRVVGGAIPKQFITSVEKGVRAQVERGLEDGVPLVDLKVTLVDGKAHSVDSSDAAFQTAGALALRAAAEQAGLVTLEPMDAVAVFIPDEHLGVVLGDLSSRRGKVVGTEPDEAGWTVVRAHVPSSELVRYSINIRSLSSGSATFTRHFERYDPMPT